MELPAGWYSLHTVSDDGIRLSVDGRMVIDDWSWHPSKEIKADLNLGVGKQVARIEQFEIDGDAELRFSLGPSDALAGPSGAAAAAPAPTEPSTAAGRLAPRSMCPR
ncbi:MAG TPA: PA14 domain-containing protein [Pirellulales bacterium]|nr:PA14 domain-containing protein [Pirellulales bacterium]